MFAGVQRDVYARHSANFVPPHAGAVDHHVTLDMARGAAVIGHPVHAGHAAALFDDIGDLYPFLDDGAALAGALGQSQRDVGRITLPVQRQINCTLDALEIDMRIQFLHALIRDFFDLDAKRPRHRSLTIDFLFAFLGQRHGDRPAALEARGDTGFLFE